MMKKLLKAPPFRVFGYCSRSRHTLPRKDGWESAIGLEVHAQIAVKSKIFSPAPVIFASAVNSNVALLDASVPGTLPVLNKATVEAGVLTALALSCQLNTVSTFDRKHYFYADLPAGYQITQQRNPLATKGQLKFVVSYQNMKAYYHSCRIHQLQLEQDSGKSLHDAESQRSLIDLNRAGIGLMEIVFEPDLKDGEEAAALIKELILILERIETCHCKMEEGGLRVDANISVNRIGEPLGIRTEVKNINTVRSVANAIEYEVKRQIEVLESGGTVTNETRSFDAELKATLPMRDKEVMQDYRFMPEPNLPPIRLVYNPDGDTDETVVNIASIQKRMKELPDVSRRKLIDQYGFTLATAMIVVDIEGCLEYFLSVMKFKNNESGEKVASFLMTSVLAALYKKELNFKSCPADPKEMAEIITSIETGLINYASAVEIANLLVGGDTRPCSQIIKDEKLIQNSDDAYIEQLCRESIELNPMNVVQKYIQAFPSNEKKCNRCLTKLLGIVRSNGGDTIDMKKASATMRRLLSEKK